MNTQLLFQTISRRMRADFDASAQVKHSGSKGTVRENLIRNFLEGRLPSKYGLGAGEVIGRVRDTSRQCDVIVYDKFNGVTLLHDESVQVYPIDCVYGIIEVKSALSKVEFLDALEKIRAFKGMAPRGSVSQRIASGFTMVHSRPKPFGVVFAYNLSDNSFDSLVANLREWEAQNSPELWPNYVCVLEAGVIYHHGKPLERCLDSDRISEKSWPIAIHHAEDSLFQFYCTLHDMCAHMQLGPVELSHYYDPSIQIGKYVVHGWGVEGERTRDGAKKTKVRLSAAAIEKVVTWCASRPAMQYGDLLQKRFGTLPIGMDGVASLKNEVFLYNPNNLPGLDELGSTPITIVENGRPALTQKCLLNMIELVIDGDLYAIAMDGFADDAYEEVGDA